MFTLSMETHGDIGTLELKLDFCFGTVLYEFLKNARVSDTLTIPSNRSMFSMHMPCKGYLSLNLPIIIPQLAVLGRI